MQLTIEGSWGSFLAQQRTCRYFTTLEEGLNREYRSGPCFPEPHMWLRALQQVDVDKVRVVILGQDPYHGVGQANGLAFSVPTGVAKPPSLTNILKECYGAKQGKAHSGDLSSWTDQGVLLLNTILSVRQGQAGSHQKLGWTPFTDALLRHLNDQEHSIVFLFWGRLAQQKEKWITATHHCVLKSGHPSPLSANRGYWFGNDHFNKVNLFLEGQGQARIDW
jgi:uracil-DNA glycosylase